MSWQDESGHELYVAATFADGRQGLGCVGDRVTVDRDADGHPLDDAQLRGPQEVTGWLVCCDCWTDGARQPRTTVLARWERVTQQAEDVGRGRVASDDPVWIMDRPELLPVLERLWDEHRAPGQAREAIERAAREAAGASSRLDQAVAAGRKVGLSWADVGRGVGITRQSARERWGHRDRSRRVEDLGETDLPSPTLTPAETDLLTRTPSPRPADDVSNAMPGLFTDDEWDRFATLLVTSCSGLGLDLHLREVDERAWADHIQRAMLRVNLREMAGRIDLSTYPRTERLR